MTAVEQVRSWSAERWLSILHQLTAEGMRVEIDGSDGQWLVMVGRDGFMKTAVGSTLTEALQKFAERYVGN